MVQSTQRRRSGDRREANHRQLSESGRGFSHRSTQNSILLNLTALSVEQAFRWRYSTSALKTNCDVFDNSHLSLCIAASRSHFLSLSPSLEWDSAVKRHSPSHSRSWEKALRPTRLEICVSPSACWRVKVKRGNARRRKYTTGTSIDFHHCGRE